MSKYDCAEVLGVKASTYEFGVDTIQSITATFSIIHSLERLMLVSIWTASEQCRRTWASHPVFAELSMFSLIAASLYLFPTPDLVAQRLLLSLVLQRIVVITSFWVSPEHLTAHTTPTSGENLFDASPDDLNERHRPKALMEERLHRSCEVSIVFLQLISPVLFLSQSSPISFFSPS